MSQTRRNKKDFLRAVERMRLKHGERRDRFGKRIRKQVNMPKSFEQAFLD